MEVRLTTPPPEDILIRLPRLGAAWIPKTTHHQPNNIENSTFGDSSVPFPSLTLTSTVPPKSRDGIPARAWHPPRPSSQKTDESSMWPSEDYTYDQVNRVESNPSKSRPLQGKVVPLTFSQDSTSSPGMVLVTDPLTAHFGPSKAQNDFKSFINKDKKHNFVSDIDEAIGVFKTDINNEINTLKHEFDDRPPKPPAGYVRVRNKPSKTQGWNGRDAIRKPITTLNTLVNTGFNALIGEKIFDEEDPSRITVPPLPNVVRLHFTTKPPFYNSRTPEPSRHVWPVKHFQIRGKPLTTKSKVTYNIRPFKGWGGPKTIRQPINAINNLVNKGLHALSGGKTTFQKPPKPLINKVK